MRDGNGVRASATRLYRERKGTGADVLLRNVPVVRQVDGSIESENPGVLSTMLAWRSTRALVATAPTSETASRRSIVAKSRLLSSITAATNTRSGYQLPVGIGNPYQIFR